MKKILLAAFFVFCAALCAASSASLNQSETAKKYASEGETPVVIFDPGSGKALGFLLFGNLDNEADEELVIPYTRRVRASDKENRALTHNQQLLVYIIKNGKKIGPIISADIEYIRRPRPYIKIERVFRNEAPKVFLMVYDGLDKGRGPDSIHTIFWNGLSSEDLKRERISFSTVLMPWDFLLYRFSDDTPTVTEFERSTREGHGKFYIHTLEKGAAWPQIPVRKIRAFEAEVRKYQEQIYWEYGN